jgi:hypothetical protein
MIASNPSWIKRNAPSLVSFCTLALSSMLIGVPRILDDPLAGAPTHPARCSAFCFSRTQRSPHLAVSIHADRNSKNTTLWDIAGGRVVNFKRRQFAARKFAACTKTCALGNPTRISSGSIG